MIESIHRSLISPFLKAVVAIYFTTFISASHKNKNKKEANNLHVYPVNSDNSSFQQFKQNIVRLYWFSVFLLLAEPPFKNPPNIPNSRCRCIICNQLSYKEMFLSLALDNLLVRNNFFLSFFLCNFSSFLCGLLLLSTHPSIQSNRQWQLFAYISLYLSCQWFAKFFEWPEIISDLIRGKKRINIQLNWMNFKNMYICVMWPLSSQARGKIKQDSYFAWFSFSIHRQGGRVRKNLQKQQQ